MIPDSLPSLSPVFGEPENCERTNAIGQPFCMSSCGWSVRTDAIGQPFGMSSCGWSVFEISDRSSPRELNSSCGFSNFPPTLILLF